MRYCQDKDLRNFLLQLFLVACTEEKCERYLRVVTVVKPVRDGTMCCAATTCLLDTAPTPTAAGRHASSALNAAR